MKTSTLSIRERVTRLVEKWYVLEPLYFLIWTTHELLANPRIQTVRTGDGRIEYNPNFLEALSDAELGEVLKAEIVRILLKHPYLRRKENAQAAYLASNVTLKEHTGTPLPFPTATEVFGSKEFDRRHFEFYYDEIMKSAQPLGGGAEEGKSGGGGSSSGGEDSTGNSSGGGSSNSPANADQQPSPDQNQPGDEDDFPPEQAPTDEPEQPENEPRPSLPDYADATAAGHENTEFWSENEWISAQVNEKIEVIQQSQNWGTIPGSLQEMILAAMRPRLDYRRILAAFRQSVLSSQRILTRMKPSRRYGFEYMGSRRDFCTKLLLALDVSGSVPSQDLRKALGMLNQFFKYGIQSVDVVMFDTQLKTKPLEVKKARRSLQITGRGGTDFNPVMKFLDENRDYDGVVIFTDGYAPAPRPPKNRRTKILWLFNSERSYRDGFPALKGMGKGAFLK